MDFNERTVVDFPKSGFKYQRRPTKVAKKLKDADRDRIETPLRDISGTDYEFVNHVSTLLDDLVDSFFILTVNPGLLAVAIHHLRLAGFFIVVDGRLDINRDFIFRREDYDPKGERMKSTLKLIPTKHKFSSEKSENYEKYVVRTIASILRYQRFLVRYFNILYHQ